LVGRDGRTEGRGGGIDPPELGGIEPLVGGMERGVSGRGIGGGSEGFGGTEGFGFEGGSSAAIRSSIVRPRARFEKS